jgi:hypothetical protein
MNKSHYEHLTNHEAKIGWRINEWAEAVGICRASTYNLMKAKKLRSVKSGAARIILTSPTEYLASLAHEAA